MFYVFLLSFRAEPSILYKGGAKQKILDLLPLGAAKL